MHAAYSRMIFRGTTGPMVVLPDLARAKSARACLSVAGAAGSELSPKL
jgi:hypothetical protein